MTGPRVLALIPARGGSKRIPRKNLAPLAGRPLIAWTIEAALAAHSVDRVVVSTDDPEIADTARSLGAGVPFLRPAALAGDQAGSLAVLRHALEALEGTVEACDLVALLQPTSPLRTADDIDAAASLFEARGARAVISVCPADHPPEWCNRLPADHSLEGFLPPEARGRRSQDLPPAYRLNGAIYLYRCQDVLQDTVPAFEAGCYAYLMPRERSVDIDEPFDLRLAEALLQERDTAARRAIP